MAFLGSHLVHEFRRGLTLLDLYRFAKDERQSDWVAWRCGGGGEEEEQEERVRPEWNVAEGNITFLYVAISPSVEIYT